MAVSDEDKKAIGYALNNSHGLEPQRYRTELFESYPLAINGEQRSEQLPWNFKFNV